MGVLGCDRKGCDNIMCERFSQKYQYYICNECFEELVEYGPNTDVEEFMNLEKEEDTGMDNQERKARDRFGDIFKKRNDL